MRLYWELARLGFRRAAAYRGATYAGVLTNTVFGFMISFVQLALFAGRTRVAGYDVSDALTYVWVSQGMLATISVMASWQEIALRVRTGDVATDFHRPVDFQGYWLAQDIGRAGYHALFRGIPPLLIACLFFHLRFPASPLTWAAFGLSLLLGICISFSLRFLVNLVSFWIVDHRGVLSICSFSWPFLSGMYGIPLGYLPDPIYRVVAILPFASMGQAPLSVFLEKPGPIATLALQAAWVVALLLLGRLVLARAERRLVVQGG
ncbi:MAG TPA: ABC-2 family transporter protein [Candidatus Dormibacteraeota bacterium]